MVKECQHCHHKQKVEEMTKCWEPQGPESSLSAVPGAPTEPWREPGDLEDSHTVDGNCWGAGMAPLAFWVPFQTERVSGDR